MRINLAPNVDFNLDRILNTSNLPVYIHLPKEAYGEIGKELVYRARIDSYPIFKDGELFDIEFKFVPLGVGYFVTDYLIPIGKELRRLYDNMEQGMVSYHLFRNLFVEEFYYDTDTKTFGWTIGS